MPATPGLASGATPPLPWFLWKGLETFCVAVKASDPETTILALQSFGARPLEARRDTVQELENQIHCLNLHGIYMVYVWADGGGGGGSGGAMPLELGAVHQHLREFERLTDTT